MTERELLKLALEALELAQDNLRDHGDNCFLHDEGEYNRCFCGKDSLSDHLQSVVEKLDEAFAQPEQEPVAWRLKSDAFDYGVTSYDKEQVDWHIEQGWRVIDVLYTTPPNRKPLTDEQIYDMYNEPRSDAEMIAFARAIEAAHQIYEDKK